MKHKPLLIIYAFCLLTAFLAPPSAFSENQESSDRAAESNETKIFLNQQEELRKSFLDQIQAGAKEVRDRLDAAPNEEEKNRITEEFRANRLKRLEEFQAEDQALAKKIEDARKQ